MIELLILFVLSSSPHTMYGVLKSILNKFSPYTKPSFGTIKPALLRLEKKNVLRTDKSISEGGRVSVMYAITPEGLDLLKKKILEVDTENPVQFLSNARLQLACAGFLDITSQKELFQKLKRRAVLIKTDAESKISDDTVSPTYFHRLVLDNTICEYNNFINLLEGLENASHC